MKTNLFSFSKKHLATLALAGALFAGGNATAQIQRVYANVEQHQAAGYLPTGSVSSAGKAVDNDAQTQDTISTPITISVNLGVLKVTVGGSETQYLEFKDGSGNIVTYHSGQKIHLKIGTPSSLLGLLSGVTIGTFKNLQKTGGQWTANTTPVYSANSLLSLLSGSGTEDIVITAQGDCNGVYVSLNSDNSLLGIGLGLSMNVYGAYVLNSASAGCPKPQDALSGVTGDLTGISAATLLSSVTHPMDAIDQNTNTAASMSAIASVACKEYLTALFDTPLKVGDTVQIIINYPNSGILNLGLLSALSFQPYLDNTAVGGSIPYNSSLLNIKLFPAGTDKATIKIPVSSAFNRISINWGSVADLSSLLGNGTLNIYEISARISSPTVSSTGAQYAYAGNATKLEANPDAAGDPIVWVDAADQSIVTNDSVPSTKAAGVYTYYALSSRNGCTDLSDTARLVLHLVSATTNSPVSGSVGQYYSSDVRVTTNPTDLPNTPPKFGYSINTTPGTTFNFSNTLSSAYVFNNRAFLSGPSVPAMTLSAFNVKGLPPGLTLNSDGTITGIPTAAGGYDFSVHVIDSANKDASGQYLVVGNFDKTISIAASLPIQVQPGSFKASLDNNKNIILSWATSSEMNSSRFNIQRSSDNQNFETVGSVNAKGNSSTGQTYSFTDKTAAGLVYYKLQEVDADNAVGYTSGVISIDNGKQNYLLISPNPATTYINISGNTGAVKIYDAAGRIVLTGQGAQIDVRSLASGVYYLLIRQNDGTTVKRSFIKK